MTYRIVEKTRRGRDGSTEYVEKSSYSWERDRNPDGSINMRDHYHLRERRFLMRRSGPDEALPYIATSIPINGGWWIYDAWGPLEAESYARFRGKLYKGSASLGVTMASWKQSREMIVTRYRQMTLESDRFELRARRLIDHIRVDRNTRRVQFRLDRLGSQYLEMVFGWQPLLADIHAACVTVINAQPAAQRVNASARTYWQRQEHLDAGVIWDEGLSGPIRVKRSATVEISNPNTWLRERAGLNNPAAVAWDLVPWSFVVNMFSNAGSLVNSITDFAGLSFPSSSITRHFDLTYRLTVSVPVPDGRVVGFGDYRQEFKQRTLGGLARPPLTLKIPDVNWELACIAASLFFQKFRKLDSLMGFVQHR